MKKVLFLLTLSGLVFLNAYDPFSILVPKKKVVVKKVKKSKKIIRKRVKLTLNSILDRYVKINDKWYKRGDKVYNYRLKDIFEDSVILKTSRGKIKILNMYNNDNQFIK